MILKDLLFQVLILATHQVKNLDSKVTHGSRVLAQIAYTMGGASVRIADIDAETTNGSYQLADCI